MFHIERLRTLLMLLTAAVVAAGLLALVEASLAWAADRSFATAPNSPLAVGSAPTTVTNADFNGDGKMDLAAQNSGSNTVSVRLGNGDGTFQAKSDVAVGSNPTSVSSADLNDDGKRDLAVANYSSNTVSVLRGNGDGTFQAKQDFPAGSNPTSVIGADFNRDGYTDLAVADFSSDKVSVLLGQDANGDGKADGTFRAASNFSIDLPCSGTCIPSTSGPNQVIAANFNGDSAVDLATANQGNCPFFCTPGGVSVLLGNGDGTFQGARLPVTGATIYSIDANSSGDIMAAKYDAAAVSVLRSNGNGTFSTGPQLSVGTNPSAVASVDLDGDARADLAVSNFTSDNVSVLFNDGSGGFKAAQNYQAGDGPIFVIGANFNADNYADLAVANQNSNNVSVLLNTEPSTPPPETTITGGPSGTGNGISATFEFSSSEPGSTFQCALDDPSPSAYSPCTSPKTVPEQGLLADGSHTFYVKATGAAGNNTDLTAATRTWTVDTVAPTIGGVSPVRQATEVPLASNVVATFSEDMKSSSVTNQTFTLTKQDSTGSMVANVTYTSANKTATLDPAAELEANTIYTARVTGGSGGVQDIAGNALSRDETWTFTTASTTPTTCTKTGTSNAETISGTSGVDVICAGGGNDTLKGLGGNDILKGEDGNDILLGGVGDDAVDGGLGADKASYAASTSTSGVTASLATNSSTGEGSDSFIGVENLLGSKYADTLTGSAAINTLTGGAGNDTLRGEDGNDVLLGGVGDDSLEGGVGIDKASYSASLTAIIASLDTNSATGEGSDTFSGVENLQGSKYADELTGSIANNVIASGAGDDKAVGGAGADTLKGEDGADAIDSKDGINGNDRLDGGAGTDTKVTDTTEKSVVGFP
jgi:hypothetical protein